MKQQKVNRGPHTVRQSGIAQEEAKQSYCLHINSTRSTMDATQISPLYLNL
jgi:hypothetical protein